MSLMITVRRAMKVKVMGLANAVGPTLIDGSFFQFMLKLESSHCIRTEYRPL